MTTDAEALVRRAYHLAEGNVMDVREFMDLFAADGMVNAGGQSYRGTSMGHDCSAVVHRLWCTGHRGCETKG